MPSDIRSFFGDGGGRSVQSKPQKKEIVKKAKGGRKVLDESDEDDDEAETVPEKPTAKKSAALKRESTPEAEATTASDYFSNRKPKKPSDTAKESPASKQSTKNATNSTPDKKATPTRSSGRKKPQVSYEENKQDDEQHEVDTPSRPKIHKALVNGDGAADSDSGNPKPKSSKARTQKSPAKGRGNASKQTTKAVEPSPAKARKKRKSEETFDDDYDNEDDDEVKVDKKKSSKRAKAPSASKPSPSKKSKKTDDELTGGGEVQAIFDSIPTVKAPSPPAPATGSGSKFQYGAHANSGPAPAAGSLDIPQGAENCLAGLTFVFTGLLNSLNRDDGQALVKRYGGKVTTAPSKKTSYIVLGSDAGPKKLQVIRDYNLKTIDEHGLMELIRRLPANGGDSKAAGDWEKKQEKEREKMEDMSAELDAAEKKAQQAAAAKAAKTKESNPYQGARANLNAPTQGPDMRLWTVKYAPTSLSQICGNRTQVEKLGAWLRAFPKNRRTNFKMAGKDGTGVYRAVIIHGPPGIGKTTAAHLVAKLEGYDIVESNASDTRSKKLVEAGLKGVLSTSSLLGYFAGDGEKVEASRKRLVLIMDEVDGMSAGDRGGVGALAAVCKKSEVPIILICNDRKLQKMKPFNFVTYDMPFRRPTVDQMRSRLATISHREGIKMPAQVLEALIAGTGADIRQIINMLSTVKIDTELGNGEDRIPGQPMDFDRSKKMSKSWEKHIVLRPWDIVNKILGGGMFANSSKATLNEKSELYFNDHELSFLMLQENYLGTKPVRASEGNPGPKQQAYNALKLAEEAASSISEGDLVDRLIHGSEQHWTLMPVHAIFSFVRPASFVAGSLAGSGGTQFPQWLGRNSTQGKLMRLVKEIQGHMRLCASGDRHDIRQQYFSLLWLLLVQRLNSEGKDAVGTVIELMDSYYLTKEDWDSLLELGVGPMDQANIKLETSTKSAFTRIYNQQSHPMPFMKASEVMNLKSKAKVKPDLEEAMDESDSGEVLADPKEEEEDQEDDKDPTKDKYVKKPKKKAGASGGAKGKKRVLDDEDAANEEGEGTGAQSSSKKAKARKR